jgi:endoglycosylceramidase
MFSTLATLLVVAVATTAAAALLPISIDVATRNFVDSAGRTHIFHGMNAVYKIAPWYPATTGFDSTTTLSRIDAKNLKSWGFNLVRLGVMWPGVEPTQGNYNSSYLDAINTIVENLAAEDIYVILDFHQDIWHRKFCGEGVPDYVYELCKSSEPEGMAPFPQPAVNATYPLDEDGNPTLEACLSESFITYYFSAEVRLSCVVFSVVFLYNTIVENLPASCGRVLSCNISLHTDPSKT